MWMLQGVCLSISNCGLQVLRGWWVPRIGVHESASSRMETLTASALVELGLATFLLGRSLVVSLLRFFSDMLSLSMARNCYIADGWMSMEGQSVKILHGSTEQP